VHWSVISILDSSKLISFSKVFLQKRVEKGNCTHVIWNLPDKSNGEFLSEKLNNLLDIIDDVVLKQQQQQQQQQKQQKQCLVHCAQGLSRSVATIAAWYISRKKSSLAEAMDVIRRVRPEAMPNFGFIACLRALEQCEGEIYKARKRLFKKHGLRDAS
jgi:protein-tyrosine phosphatase